MIAVAILTISDSCAQGRREDLSGSVLAEMLSEAGFGVSERTVVPDDADAITMQLCRLVDRAEVDLILTTGGTGLGPRDVTPEATALCCDRMVPGIPEMMRLESLRKTSRAALSRGIAGVRNRTLIINLPGSPKAVRECLEVVIDILPHAVEMMRGGGH